MEQKYCGFWGRIARLNLTDGKKVIEEPDPGFYRKYMGGRNIALHYLINELSPGTVA